MTTESADKAMTVGAIRIELEIPIDAAPERVWKALVDDTGAWWPKDFYITADPGPMTLEAKAGGRLFERGKNGSELLWFTVFAIDPEKSMDLVGHLAPAYGGPATTMLHLELEPHGAGATLLKVCDAIFGHIGEKIQSIQDGWRIIFHDNLKAFVERDG